MILTPIIIMCTQENSGQAVNDELNHIVSLYNTLFTKFNQEGDGIWRRFHFMAAINLTFYASFFVVLKEPEQLPYKSYYLISICAIGILFCSWSLYVQVRLWKWHQVWRNELKKIELSFPDRPGWTKPLIGNKYAVLKHDPGEKRSFLIGYTQVYLYIFIIIWLIFMVSLI